MEEKDFKRIEELFYNFSAEFDQKLELQTAVFQGQLENHSRDFRNWIGTERESFQHKLDLVVEVDGIAVDLSAHRRDTEAHRSGWRVREE